MHFGVSYLKQAIFVQKVSLPLLTPQWLQPSYQLVQLTGISVKFCRDEYAVHFGVSCLKQYLIVQAVRTPFYTPQMLQPSYQEVQPAGIEASSRS